MIVYLMILDGSYVNVRGALENHLKREDDAESVLRQAFTEEFRAQSLPLWAIRP